MTHAYDNPQLDARGFLLAVMHSTDTPLDLRMRAASALMGVQQETIVDAAYTVHYIIPDITSPVQGHG
jgi:hypothetical protein